MAPTLIPTTTTMSNPNTNALISLLRNSTRDNSTTAAGFKTVYLGQDNLPVSILEIAPITDPAWKKNACYESFSLTLRKHMEDINISDLTCVVANELPIDTTSAFVEASAIKDKIMAQAINVSNLTGCAFLKSNGNLAKVPTSLSVDDRTEDLSFVRVSCTLDGASIDPRVKQDPFVTQFCLKLPQSSYNKTSKEVTAIDNPVKNRTPAKNVTSITTGTNLLSAFSASGTPSVPSTSSPTASTSSSSAPFTPKMNKLLSMGSSSSGEVISYFGGMTFLDDQSAFLTTFGYNPTILPYNAIKNEEGGPRNKLLAYANKCMFDVFLYICQEDYVGDISVKSEKKMIIAICKEIADIKMERRHGQRSIDTPDEIYARYISIASGLPDTASKWTITLCSSYYNCLPQSLQDQMDTDGFDMPDLSTQTTKALQLKALRAVRTAAASAFKTLCDEESRLRKLFPNQHSNRSSIFLTGEVQNNTAQNLPPPPPPPPPSPAPRYAGHTGQFVGQHLYQNHSLAERTIASYTDPDNKNPNNLPCRTGRDGKLYPFNPNDPTYLSKFEVGFRGCFKCGGRDHRDRANCPLANITDPALLRTFFKELEIHRPNFRSRRQGDRQRDNDNQYYGRQNLQSTNGVSYIPSVTLELFQQGHIFVFLEPQEIHFVLSEPLCALLYCLTHICYVHNYTRYKCASLCCLNHNLLYTTHSHYQ